VGYDRGGGRTDHARCRRFDIDSEWKDGFIAAAVTPRRAGELKQWVDTLAHDYGYDRIRLIERAELPEWIASSRYRAAAFDAGSGQLHPLKYTLGLARGAAGLGVKIFEGSRAIEVRPGRLSEVRTAEGAVHCSHVLLAGNVYLGDLMPQLAARIMPVGTFIAASRPLGAERASQLLPRGRSRLRHAMGARLLPPVPRSPDDLWRARELQHHPAGAPAAGDAASDAGGFSAARRCSD